ncbi:MAG: nucleotidyltransferase domain-containing protein [Kiritimatiellae bacterium]|jgi:predicted nucleotidyltransferase|nr:nucleotidyltransferase domain-containing protein [Kiritimatiellia bacterium]
MKFDINKLAQLFEATGLLDFALLLGSAQDGVVKDGSDIDIAVIFKADVHVDYDVMARLFRIVDEIVPGVKCDLIRLNTASETVCFEALRGRLLFVADGCMDRYADFYSRTCREYEDYRTWSARQIEYRRYAT